MELFGMTGGWPSVMLSTLAAERWPSVVRWVSRLRAKRATHRSNTMHINHVRLRISRSRGRHAWDACRQCSPIRIAAFTAME
jgi:hypothetical protein